mmetsp:Transcript_21389/g.69217  ORF Transcript_21389/g.69217 Transcript_21389/m.69217 type:complete len:420 (+) Transcript_21389:2-1261(+)
MAGNALGVLQEISPPLAQKVLQAGTVTGDRVNGLLDGKTGDWYCRFDTRKPSTENKLPLTVVLSRYELQEILLSCLEPGTVTNAKEVVRYEQDAGGVDLFLSDGSQQRCDVLVGADGIRSNIRKQMKEKSPLAGIVGDDPVYAGFTCYTSTCEFEPPDIDEIGYQVFLGNNKYFVQSDIGPQEPGGKSHCQWYAFEKQAPGKEDDDGKTRKEKLKEIFGEWCPAVMDRIEASDNIERRDIYDRRPTLNWVDGRVCLLGDAAHAMQPNLGQGGCQAMEDAHRLGEELKGIIGAGNPNLQTPLALQSYQLRRIGRAGAVMGFARFAALMTTTYRGVLGADPYDFYPEPVQSFWHQVEKLNIPHPGAVLGQVAIMGSIQPILQYVTAGGDTSGLPEDVLKIQKMRDIPDDVFTMRGIPGFAK